MTHSSVTWLIRVWRDSFECDMAEMVGMTRSLVTQLRWLNLLVWHDSFNCDMTHSTVTWLIQVWHDSFKYDMTHSTMTWLIQLWHDSFNCDMTHSTVTWLIRVWHDSFECDMTHIVEFKRDMTDTSHVSQSVMSHSMSHVTGRLVQAWHDWYGGAWLPHVQIKWHAWHDSF